MGYKVVSPNEGGVSPEVNPNHFLYDPSHWENFNKNDAFFDGLADSHFTTLEWGPEAYTVRAPTEALAALPAIRPETSTLALSVQIASVLLAAAITTPIVFSPWRTNPLVPTQTQPVKIKYDRQFVTPPRVTPAKRVTIDQVLTSDLRKQINEIVGVAGDIIIDSQKVALHDR